jgi:hypothetical protein
MKRENHSIQSAQNIGHLKFFPFGKILEKYTGLISKGFVLYKDSRCFMAILSCGCLPDAVPVPHRSPGITLYRSFFSEGIVLMFLLSMYASCRGKVYLVQACQVPQDSYFV